MEALNTEPCAVAPDARVNFGVKQIALNHRISCPPIAKSTLASGATALGSVVASVVCDPGFNI